MALIRTSDLKTGMKIGKNVYNKEGILLLEKNIRITSSRQIEILDKEGIKFVVAQTGHNSGDDDRGQEISKSLDSLELSLSEISKKLDDARQQINKVVILTGEVFNKIIDESNINRELGVKSMEIVTDFIENIEDNQDIFSSLEEIKEKDANLLNHSVHVCTNSLLIGMKLNYTHEELVALGTASLLHDIGKIKIDNRLISHLGSFSPEEERELRKHPDYSEYYLRKMGNIGDEVIRLVSLHHENFDGSGYNQGLLNTNIHNLILVASNSYNNLISHPDTSQRLSPVTALRKIGEQIDRIISKEIYMLLLETVGFYPVGTLVQVNSGDVGKVIMHNKIEPQHPKILIKFDKYKTPTNKIIDTSLRTRAGSASKYLYQITKVIDTK